MAFRAKAVACARIRRLEKSERSELTNCQLTYWVLSPVQLQLNLQLGYLPPNIPGMLGIPIRPPPAIFFIIFCISRN